MGAAIYRDDNGTLVLSVGGILHKKELDQAQAKALRIVGAEEKVKLLVVVLDDFRGWVRTEEWGDLSFFLEHGERIVKMAIVGRARWRDKMLAFAGAGVRATSVKYFLPDGLTEAEEWLNA